MDSTTTITFKLKKYSPRLPKIHLYVQKFQFFKVQVVLRIFRITFQVITVSNSINVFENTVMLL